MTNPCAISGVSKCTPLPLSSQASPSLACAIANRLAGVFSLAGHHIAWPLASEVLVCRGDTAKAGMLAVAVGLRDVLSQSPEGREALHQLGFEPVSE